MKFTDIFPSDHWGIITIFAIIYSAVLFFILAIGSFCIRKCYLKRKKVLPLASHTSNQIQGDYQAEAEEQEASEIGINNEFLKEEGISSRNRNEHETPHSPINRPGISRVVQCYVHKSKDGKLVKKFEPITMIKDSLVATMDEKAGVTPIYQQNLCNSSESKREKTPKKLKKDFLYNSEQVEKTEINESPQFTLVPPLQAVHSEDSLNKSELRPPDNTEIILYKYETQTENDYDDPSLSNLELNEYSQSSHPKSEEHASLEKW